MNLVAESLPVDIAKTRKRPAVKASPRPPAEKQKLTLYVSTESAQRLAVHATMTGVDRSALIETLIREQLKRFVVQDRARPPAESLTVTEIGTESSV